jgi:nucleoside phosphorylase
MTERVKDKELPRRIDFVILGMTTEERDRINAIFKFRYQKVLPKIGKCFWTYLESGDKAVSVVLVTAGSGYGDTIAYFLTQSVATSLFPEYIMVVGHALGINRKNKGSTQIGSGDVVVSYFLNVGEFRTPTEQQKPEKTNPLRAIKVLPPSDLLTKIAAELESGSERKNYRILVDKELVCGQHLEQRPSGQTLQGLVNSYPRIVGYEMEGKGVASSLTDLYNSGERVPEYVIVKGISDCFTYKKTSEGVYRPLPDKGDNPKLRKEKSLKATDRSAAFAKKIIDYYVKNYTQRRCTCVHSYRDNLGFINKDCNGILHGVTPIDLSDIIEFNVKRSYAEESRPTYKHDIFTVCALEPFEWWDTIKYLFKVSGGEVNEKNKKKQAEKFIEWSRLNFPHLSKFKDIAKSCKRILLMRDRKYKTRNKPYHWSLFRGLNQGVECYMLFRDDVRDQKFLTDFTVIDGLVLDYYYDSNTLIICEPRSPEIRKYLLGIHKYFNDPQKKATYFKPLYEKELLKLSTKKFDYQASEIRHLARK